MTDLEQAIDRPRRALVVEPRFRPNEGHHHTQIAALGKLLPGVELSLLAGPDCADIPGFPTFRIDGPRLRRSRLATKLRWGTWSQRLRSLFAALVSGGVGSLPASRYGADIVEAVERCGFGRSDLVVIPSADLGALESAEQAILLLGARAPRFHLRFLAPGLGENDARLRERRVRAHRADETGRLALYTETTELSEHLARTTGIATRGGFYMPCIIDLPEDDAAPLAPRAPRTVIGVLGSPRREKGCDRIAGIIRATAALVPESDPGVEFRVQGTVEDTRDGGALAGLPVGRIAGTGVDVVLLGATLESDRFEDEIRSADAVLLPYRLEPYAVQGSGVVQDAVAARRIVIHTRGLSMRDFLCHGNALAATTDAEFAEAVVRVSRDRAAFDEGTAAALANFRRSMTSAHPFRNAATSAAEIPSR